MTNNHSRIFGTFNLTYTPFTLQKIYIQYLQERFLFSMTLTTLSFRKRVEFIIHYLLLVD